MSLIALKASVPKLRNVKNTVIEQMINLLPDYSAGTDVHTIYVNKLKGSLPGHYSKLIGTGKSFRSIFFPDWQEKALSQYVSSDTGLADNWWSDFSVAVLCQSIDNLTHNLRKQMQTDKINNAVNDFNTTMRSHSSIFYSRVLKTNFPPFAKLIAQLNISNGKEAYAQGLLDNVDVRQIWYASGMWQSPDWEMFNHYAKYMALGASQEEVNQLIDELTSAGLPIPEIVDRHHWKSYADFLREHPYVDHNAIDAVASGPILEPVYQPSYGPYPASPMKEGNAYEFTANGQPGSRYRSTGGSCLSKDTEILLADGTAQKIQDMKTGNLVLTPQGSAAVTYVFQLLLAGRKLYQINGNSPLFTATHPFINPAYQPDESETYEQAIPELLCTEPQRLGWEVPTLSRSGIGRLQTGSSVFCRQAGEQSTPEPIPVASVREVTTSESDQSYVYDLYLTCKPADTPGYWAGKDGLYYLVSPEAPIINRAQEAAETILELMSGLLNAGIPGVRPGDVSSLRSLAQWLYQYGASACQHALQEALETVLNFQTENTANVADVQTRFDRLFSGQEKDNSVTAAAVGTIIETVLGSVGNQIESYVATGWRSFRDLGGNVLSVTMFDLMMTPHTPLPAGAEIELAVAIKPEQGSALQTRIWDRQGRKNTRFHHYFDQLVNIDASFLAEGGTIEFSGFVDQSPLPSLQATYPIHPKQEKTRYTSACLRDALGKTIGFISFDWRLLPESEASNEMGNFSHWTLQTASSYARALGKAMVLPLHDLLQKRLEGKKTPA